MVLRSSLGGRHGRVRRGASAALGLVYLPALAVIVKLVVKVHEGFRIAAVAEDYVGLRVAALDIDLLEVQNDVVAEQAGTVGEMRFDGFADRLVGVVAAGFRATK